MEAYKIQLIETLVLLVLYGISYYATNTFINNTLKKTQIQRGRRKIIIKAVYLLNTMTTLVLLAAIWGLEQNEIAVFVTTILTVLGIGFFAQWSLLSNITAGIILFFNHPMKIGDTIKVFDKDFPIEGEITDLTYFFVYIKINVDEIVTIPNTLLLQKSISIVEKMQG
jgi:small-conductance mechanosensitive channel